MACLHNFSGGKKVDIVHLWAEYVAGKQTYRQLSKKHKISVRTVQRKIKLHQVSNQKKQPRKIVLLMDTTYWKRGIGVMLFKDAYTKENLLKYYVISETNALYLKGYNELKTQGFDILGIVCDGRRGLFQLFGDIPVQMCQFHQAAIIRKYLTKNPVLPASIALKEIVSLMKITDRESFEGLLKDWYIEWETYLNERTTNPVNGKTYFTHKRLRSAYRSLNTNLKWLYTWYDNYELNMPNTTNSIDGHFSDLKTKLRNHNGLSKVLKMKFIDEFLKV
jgi:hypothetical protein